MFGYKYINGQSLCWLLAFACVTFISPSAQAWDPVGDIKNPGRIIDNVGRELENTRKNVEREAGTIRRNIKRETRKLDKAITKAERDAEEFGRQARRELEEFPHTINRELTKHCGFTGYKDNRPKAKMKVARGSWVVAWSEPISETHAAEGTIAVGISVAVGNPGPFVAWALLLVERVVASIQGSMDKKLKSEVRDLLEDEAIYAVSEVLRGRSPSESKARFGNIDIKVGAITYWGGQYLCGEKTAPTFGRQIYVAVRLRNQKIKTSLQGAPKGRKFHFKNKCNNGKTEIALRYRTLSGEWITEGWWTMKPGSDYRPRKKGAEILTNNNVFYFYAYTIDVFRFWGGDEENKNDRTYFFDGKKRRFKRIKDENGDLNLTLVCD